MSNRHIFPTSLKDVQPGDETGEYYVTFCNLPFNTTWQEMKDWMSASCPLDYIEIFPTSCSGWIRLKGRDNLEKALAHLRSECFKDRYLLFDSRNETEAIKIRFKETSPKPKHARRKRGPRGDRSQKVPWETHDRRSQASPYSGPWTAAEAAERRAHEEFLALASLMFSTRAQSALQMQYPAPAFPYYQAEYCTGMGMDYYGNPYSPYAVGGSLAGYPRQAVSGYILPQSFGGAPDAV